MAGGAVFGGMLEVSRCVRETARERYRVPKNTTIPYEVLAPLVFVEAEAEGDQDEDENEDDGVMTGSTDDAAGLEDNSSLSDDAVEDNEGGGVELGQLDDASELTAPGALDILQDFDLDAFLHEEATEADIFAISTALGVTPAAMGDPPAGEVDFADFIDGEVMVVDGEPEDPDEEDELESNSANSDSDGPDSPEGRRRVPEIARWRLNLTALSQVYNLYFVAFRNQIHVSKPRSCISHNLPQAPDLVLKPDASHIGFLLGGYIDRQFPHQVNHLIVGDFGDEEILLLAYDDGDVIGYFTKLIEDEILRREEWPPVAPRTVKPFFHENVAKSAWGLAIHKQSRLIAVGSNGHVATVFAPSLTGCSYEHLRGADTRILYRTLIKDHQGVPRTNVDLSQDDTQGDSSIDDLLRRRDANWKIVLETGPLGDNIPNLAFASDKDGNAERVVAVDITGNIWLMDIWTPFTPHERIPGIHQARAASMPGDIGKPRGWGVVVLQESSFLPTRDFKESLGLSDLELRYASNARVGQWIDISRGIKYIAGNSAQQPSIIGRRAQQHVSYELGRLIESDYWFEAYSNTTPARWPRTPPVPRVVSHSSRGPRTSLEPFPDGPSGHNGGMKPKSIFGDGSSILRTYETDIELRSHLHGGVGIMFQHATRQLHQQRWAHERLSNNLYVPELSLVVIASMSGRVALATLTRPRGPQLDFERGFRIEAILPAAKEENEGWRPMCNLLGVAIGPLPFAGKPEKVRLSSPPARPRRYRLMIQYYDLDILSYEISRDSATDSLSIL